MRTLYIDCFSGVSGDMTIAALLDLGLNMKELEKELTLLKLDGEYTLSVKKLVKNGITATKFDVKLSVESDENKDIHTHDSHEELHVDNGHHHHHHHSHTHHHGDHEHHHRTYQDIVKMIKTSELSDKVKDKSLQMFKVIGEAEAKIHGMTLEDVHFHEVGAIDSIIDIVGVAILVEKLKVDKIVAAKVPVGSGHIHIDHGVYPVPAPATLEVLKGVPIKNTNIKSELTTPTGAAIIKVLVDEFSTFPEMKVQDIGYGAGTKTFPEHPNVLRMVLGEQ